MRKSPFSSFSRSAFSVFFTCVLCACGKYAAPFSPEKVAPQAVGSLVATGTDKSVVITWNTPESDRRDKSLKEMDGFSVYRKDIVTNKDITNEDIPFELLVEIPDKAIFEREKRREEARELGAISRRVKIDPTLSGQRYEDATVERGKSYLYKVVPTNQGGVEGEVREFVSITFRGPESDISIVSAKKLGVEDFLSQQEIPVQ